MPEPDERLEQTLSEVSNAGLGAIYLLNHGGLVSQVDDVSPEVWVNRLNSITAAIMMGAFGRIPNSEIDIVTFPARMRFVTVTFQFLLASAIGAAEGKRDQDTVDDGIAYTTELDTVLSKILDHYWPMAKGDHDDDDG